MSASITSKPEESARTIRCPICSGRCQTFPLSVMGAAWPFFRDWLRNKLYLHSRCGHCGITFSVPFLFEGLQCLWQKLTEPERTTRVSGSRVKLNGPTEPRLDNIRPAFVAAPVISKPLVPKNFELQHDTPASQENSLKVEPSAYLAFALNKPWLGVKLSLSLGGGNSTKSQSEAGGRKAQTDQNGPRNSPKTKRRRVSVKMPELPRRRFRSGIPLLIVRNKN